MDQTTNIHYKISEKKFQMENLKHTATLILASTKLTKSTKNSKVFHPEIYQSTIGSPKEIDPKLPMQLAM